MAKIIMTGNENGEVEVGVEGSDADVAAVTILGTCKLFKTMAVNLGAKTNEDIREVVANISELIMETYDLIESYEGTELKQEE